MNNGDEILYNITYSGTPASGTVISQTVSYIFNAYTCLIIYSFIKYSDLSLLYSLQYSNFKKNWYILILNAYKDKELNSLSIFEYTRVSLGLWIKAIGLPLVNDILETMLVVCIAVLLYVCYCGWLLLTKLNIGSLKNLLAAMRRKLNSNNLNLNIILL